MLLMMALIVIGVVLAICVKDGAVARDQIEDLKSKYSE